MTEYSNVLLIIWSFKTTTTTFTKMKTELKRQLFPIAPKVVLAIHVLIVYIV